MKLLGRECRASCRDDHNKRLGVFVDWKTDLDVLEIGVCLFPAYISMCPYFVSKRILTPTVLCVCTIVLSDCVLTNFKGLLEYLNWAEDLGAVSYL